MHATASTTPRTRPQPLSPTPRLVVYCRLSPYLRSRLEQMAEELGISLPEMIRRLISNAS